MPGKGKLVTGASSSTLYTVQARPPGVRRGGERVLINTPCNRHLLVARRRGAGASPLKSLKSRTDGRVKFA